MDNSRNFFYEREFGERRYPSGSGNQISDQFGARDRVGVGPRDPILVRDRPFAIHEVPDNQQPKNRPPLTTSEKNRLRKLRSYGVDTTNLVISEAMALDMEEVRINYLAKTQGEPPISKSKKRKAAQKAAAKGLRGPALNPSARPSFDKRTNVAPEFDYSPSFKKLKTQMGFTNNSVVVAKSSGIKVAVIPRGFPQKLLSKEEADIIEQAITAKIDHVIKSDFGPQFENCRYMDGFLGFICGNEASKIFLIDFMAMDFGGSYTVVDMKDLPPRLKVMLYLPKVVDAIAAFQRLEKQNKGLSCAQWKLLSESVEDGCYKVIAAIGQETAKYLEESQGKLWYSTTRITARVLGGKEKSESWPPKDSRHDGDFSPAVNPAARQGYSRQ